MNARQIKACRTNEIRFMADRHDGDVERAGRLYNRCVRFSLRRYRWAVDHCNGGMRGYELERHNHEGELLDKLAARLDDELRPYRLHLEYNGLYPELFNELSDRGVELIWY